MVWIPDEYQDLLKDETRAFSFLATLMKDGSPQLTPVWFILDGEHILVNSARGRVKDYNMRRDPRIALTIIDPQNPYRYMQIRGKVIEIDEKSAREVIDRLAKKYTGKDKFSGGPPDEIRVTYRIFPERITT